MERDTAPSAADTRRGKAIEIPPRRWRPHGASSADVRRSALDIRSTGSFLPRPLALVDAIELAKMIVEELAGSFRQLRIGQRLLDRRSFEVGPFPPQQNANTFDQCGVRIPHPALERFG